MGAKSIRLKYERNQQIINSRQQNVLFQADSHKRLLKFEALSFNCELRPLSVQIVPPEDSCV